jgi:hypothetical protein
MTRIERPARPITTTKIRLAAALALAAASFLYLAVMVSAETAQVRERVTPTASATDDMIHMRRLGPASWHCATVPISDQCSLAQAAPYSGAIEGVGHGITSQVGNLDNQITSLPTRCMKMHFVHWLPGYRGYGGYRDCLIGAIRMDVLPTTGLLNLASRGHFVQ